MEGNVLRNIEARIHQLDRDLGIVPLYRNSDDEIGYFLDLFIIDDESRGMLNYIFTFIFYYRTNKHHYTDSVYEKFGINKKLKFFDTIVLSALYQRCKEGDEYDENDWLVLEKVMFYSLLFLTLYDKHYEENLNIISVMAKNFRFTSEELKDYCLAVNTFISGEDIFSVDYNTDRAKLFFCKK